MIHSLINNIIFDTKVQVKEQVGTVYKYSSTQVQAPPEIAEKVLKFVLSIPDDKVHMDPKDPSLGRELEPHVTIKYGLETKIPDEVEEAVKDESEGIKVTLGTISLFEPEDKPYDVLKVDIHSDDLIRLNKIFSSLPNQDTHPDYHPHLTLAYVKKGQGDEYLDSKDFEGLTFETNSFYFKSSDGDATLIELKAEVPFDESVVNKSLKQFLDAQSPEENEENEILKGQNPVPFMTSWQ